MFVEVNEQYINAVYVSSLKKDTSEGYKLIYNLASGGSLVEEFSSESDLNDKYDSVKSAMSGGGGGSTGIKYLVVDELPQTGVEGTIYLVPKQSSKQRNVKDEYMWINNDWEKIGDTEIDLSNYQTLISASNKVNADFIDDSNSTNKFMTASEKKEALDIYATNSDFSAFEGHKPGIYLVAPNSTSRTIKFLNTSGSSSGERYSFNTIQQIVVCQDLTDISKVENNTVIAVVECTNNQGYKYVYSVSKSSATTMSVSYNNSSMYQTITEYAQSFSGVKTFNSLPECSSTPSTDNQLVNKKYVDDNAGGQSSFLLTPTSSDPIDISNLDKGVYTVKITNDSRNIYYRNQGSVNSAGLIAHAFLIVHSTLDDVKEKVDQGYTTNAAFLYTVSNNGDSAIVVYDVGYKKMNGSYVQCVSIFNLPGINILSNTNQRIQGVKTFASVPVCTITPTSNDQLVNKKYVDDAIAAITDATDISY